MSSSSSTAIVAPRSIFRPIWTPGDIGVRASAVAGSVNIISVKGKPVGHHTTHYQIYESRLPTSQGPLINIKSNQKLRSFEGDIRQLTKDKLTILLKAGDKYKVRVRAKTNLGWGPWSAFLSFTGLRKGRLFRTK